MIDETAEQITELVKKTDTNDRGLLYLKISKMLKLSGQGYTGMLFRAMADTYGYKKGEF